jgi:integrase/recombinase XerD
MLVLPSKRTESTISRYRERINTLYEHLAATNNQVKDITAQNLIQYVKHVNEMKSPIDRNNTIMTIRVFFRYLCSCNLLQNNCEEYWMSLLKYRNIYQPKIQSVYTQEEVNALINAINRGCPQGKRDYAMILLAARYGLRVSDIVGMRHCNLDWEHNNIVVIQLKTSKKVVLPLSEEVGNAIIEYLKYGRPNIDLPYIFITAHAPYGQTNDLLRNESHNLRLF